MTASGNSTRQSPHSDSAGSTATVARGDDSDGRNAFPTDAEDDVHYFDVLHPILLSHVRRANSDGVLALLSLPSIAESNVFWRTCTYREGLVAAVLMYIMEHTGQVATVSASPPTLPTPTGFAGSPVDILATSDERTQGSRARSQEATLHVKRQSSLPSLSHHFSTAPSVPSGAATVTNQRFPTSPSPPPTPLTADDLHALLHLCVGEGTDVSDLHEIIRSAPSSQQRTDADGTERPCALHQRHPAALASLLRVGRALREQRRASTTLSGGACTPITQRWPIGDLRETPAVRGLDHYIQGVMRRLEAMMAAEVEQPGLDVFPLATRKRPRPSDAPKTTSSSTSVGDTSTGTPLSSGSDPHCATRGEVMATAYAETVSLAALSAVLQEHCHDMSYVNPLHNHHTTSAAAEESRESTTTTATTTMGISSSTSNDSLANIVQATGTTTTTNCASAQMTEAGTSIAGLMHTALPAVPKDMKSAHAGATEDTAAGDVSGGLDAVALLRRIPAISATRWALPSRACNTADCNSGEIVGGSLLPLPAKGATGESGLGEVEQRQKRGAAASVSAGSPSRRPRTSSTASAATVAPPLPPPQQQRHVDEELTRLSASIQVFDAFTSALEQSAAAAAADMSGGRERPSPALTAAPSSSSKEGPVGSRAVERPAMSGGHHSETPASLPPSSSGVRRRHKFSPQEDAAILHGIARFGQMSGSFQYILHAYRGVWRVGRTALHLYDHWRGALRRRAVAAFSDEATSHEGCRTLNKEPDEEDEAKPTSPLYSAALNNEQDLSSEIEDSSSE
ncbi:hypothetical protein JKF63_06609 [Porcisia hertigi]|uniref:Uncharacterized protein n=1 Tax=Porcisia hertigi TaxID=2761500 RepID=A0A836IM19_9TRYP|nr:hypothetical protein JKF63_06609 [Porcisia hertigi]